jgi:hypothetical protein
MYLTIHLLHLLLTIIFNKFILKNIIFVNPLLIIINFSHTLATQPAQPAPARTGCDVANTRHVTHTLYTWRQFQISITSVNQGFGVTSLISPRPCDLMSCQSFYHTSITSCNSD